MTGTRIRWAAAFGVAAAVSALLAASGWLAPPASHLTVAREPAGCTILQAENERSGAPTTLRLLSLPGGVTRRVSQAGYWINAMGYSAAQNVVYGVADGTRAGRYHGAHAVRIDAAGVVTDLGVIGRAGAPKPVWSPVTGATAGAVDGARWYVRQGSDLYTVDIDPAGADYLRVVHRTSLRPVSLAIGVDDFAVDPADGLLYGVSATSRGDSSVVTLDPASGKVAVVPGLRFPEGGAYGSVVLAPGAIYATANQAGRRSATFRLPRDGSGPATEVATGPPLVSGDAAGCLAEPPARPPTTSPPPTTPPGQSSPPPTTPPGQSSEPPPPRTETPSPEPSPEPPPPPPPVEQPVVLPPAPVPAPTPPAVVTPPPSTPAPSPPPPAPPTTHHARPEEKTEPVAQDTGRRRTQEKRRWGLTALILVLGGGAAAAHGRRHR
ncbi:hypothetical protein AMES_1512 [Amycolatopsis mediterranei S699]|uniref:DUF6923 domain-containing protein n=2 Tax=Amycolatopsis mediterranei TaxID=33910 RepID=A0A0H3CZ41_AMYMU|nr:hypothetical protein [Amycolatopsis mediterranei]ADJ43335.1 hypothetical protein AMED_1522 [Amycolatopsis mediterranei U32]AEK40037.1 hypothetical protein RAM_07725 [Amycolatopsis mediterranei S699]AFO75048.1 hypothetical protein AMES_1512 [Amycolatopsis mediterranei S699]AGT82177.1 hypothetical protein B737_1513 [Amycolatopsis mediterranei RB]KDO11759.1 hypothetical protein DV26_06900 [Amycolatopsis mediterranei]